MKASIISNPTAGNPERVASTQPRVGAAAPTLGSRTSGSNPVRVEANQTAAGTAAATSEVEAGNGVARTILPSAGPFPNGVWVRGETSGSPNKTNFAVIDNDDNKGPQK